MKFNECQLRDELVEGLIQYGRDANLSPSSIIESLLEEFLCKKGYLVYGVGDEIIPFPAELNQITLKHTYDRGNGTLRIYCSLKGNKKANYGSTNDYNEAKIIVDFLECKNWDLKYSTSQTKLRGRKQIDFLLNEIEREKELKETE